MAVRLQSRGTTRLTKTSNEIQWRTAALGAVAAFSLAACATAPAPSARLAGMGFADGARTTPGLRPRAYNRPYQVRGRWYTPLEQPGYDKVGLASWYSYQAGRRTTADGEVFDARVASAAHTTLPIPSWIEVTNLDNGRSARIRLNDRGPFVSGRLLDVSRGAAEELGFIGRGVAHVRVRYLGPASASAFDAPLRLASQSPVPASALPRDYASAAPAVRVLSAGAEVAEDAAALFDDEPGRSGAPEPQPVAAVAGVRNADGSPGAASSPAGFSVQAGAFADRSNAERAAERLSGAGAAQIRPLERAGRAVLYRVVVGAWTQADDAASARARIAALGFSDATVIAR